MKMYRNTFEGDVPKLSFSLYRGSKEVEKIFAQAILRKRIKEAPKLLIHHMTCIILGLVAIVLSSAVIATSFKTDPGIIPIAVVMWVFGTFIFSEFLYELQEPIELIRNKAKYKKCLED